MQTTDTNNFFQAEADFAVSEARAQKAARTKTWGEPIELAGKVLRMRVEGNECWIADSGAVVRRVDLESGKTRQLFKGHTGPVTSFEFYGAGTPGTYLFSGSWDMNIKVWDIKTKETLSTTKAHSDFVKTLLVIPSIKVLISGSSDKTVRIWDLESLEANPREPLKLLGSIAGHTRPVECLAIDPEDGNPSAPTLYTADSMGVIKIWQLEKVGAQYRGNLLGELKGHRVGITEMWVGQGGVWTASSDKSVLYQPFPQTDPVTPHSALEHDETVKSLLPLSLTALSRPLLLTGSGDKIFIYDVTSFGEKDGKAIPIGEMDAHAHDVTGIRLWVRTVKAEDGVGEKKEAWIVSGSLDSTVRKWRLQDLLSPPPEKVPEEKKSLSTLTEEEERELEELMADD